MIYRIADFNFEFVNAEPALHNYCADFRSTETAADASISISQEDIQKEIDLYNENSEGVSVSSESRLRQMCMLMAAYRKICAFVLQHDGFMMHAAVIDYKSDGFAFSARSGTGKTTHINLWRKLFGEDNVTIVNGDKPILRFIDGRVYAYGTPWNGKEQYGTNGRTELKGLCFVERGQKNEIERLSSEEAVPRLFSQILIAESTDLCRQLELADMLIEKVPIYLLKCNMEEEAARVAYDGMKN